MAFPGRQDYREPFTLKIDFDQLIWQALQKVNTSFDSPEFTMSEQHTKFGGTAASRSKISLERYEDNVLNVLNYILPEWIEKDNQTFWKRVRQWAAKKTEYLGLLASWKRAHENWTRDGKQDLLIEPLQPVDPGDKPKPFSEEVQDCYIGGEWQPFKLHRAIIQFLHRRDFFKRRDQIEEMEAESLLEPGKEEEESQDDYSKALESPTGLPTGTTSELETAKT